MSCQIPFKLIIAQYAIQLISKSQTPNHSLLLKVLKYTNKLMHIYYFEKELYRKITH